MLLAHETLVFLCMGISLESVNPCSRSVGDLPEAFSLGLALSSAVVDGVGISLESVNPFSRSDGDPPKASSLGLALNSAVIDGVDALPSPGSERLGEDVTRGLVILLALDAVMGSETKVGILDELNGFSDGKPCVEAWIGLQMTDRVFKTVRSVSISRNLILSEKLDVECRS